MTLGIILILGGALTLAAHAAAWRFIAAQKEATIADQAETITALEAKVAERSKDVIDLGRTILHERIGREREYEHGRG